MDLGLDLGLDKCVHGTTGFAHLLQCSNVALSAPLRTVQISSACPFTTGLRFNCLTFSSATVSSNQFSLPFFSGRLRCLTLSSATVSSIQLSSVQLFFLGSTSTFFFVLDSRRILVVSPGTRRTRLQHTPKSDSAPFWQNYRVSACIHFFLAGPLGVLVYYLTPYERYRLYSSQVVKMYV